MKSHYILHYTDIELLLTVGFWWYYLSEWQAKDDWGRGNTCWRDSGGWSETRGEMEQGIYISEIYTISLFFRGRRAVWTAAKRKERRRRVKGKMAKTKQISAKLRLGFLDLIIQQSPSIPTFFHLLTLFLFLFVVILSAAHDGVILFDF